MVFIHTVYPFEEKVRQLESLSSQKEKLYQLLQIYLDVFPALDAYLFRYSPLEYLGEGMIAVTLGGFSNIGNIRDDIRTLPLIYAAIREREAKYSTGKEYFLLHASCKYSTRYSMDSLGVVPISFGRVVIGYICSTQFANDAVIDEKIIASLTQYGKLAGKVLDETLVVEKELTILSNRELEVMMRIAKGESTKEMADYMGISEVTVKQYVKFAIKKLDAENRAHAIAILFQRGILKGS
ncbi:LuxR family transcriptional regulator [Bacillus sp. B15-48]|uniref:response regulator transcription factor n=1 Tax=Bacillus sp. B15-48 TaxID=1548601 RepID=UPI0019401ABE|nr:LuxR family transcriptional regulator [Bacillus sp. B15-48]MBM4765009.1 helix-turn-helix transcriptional regulator [Bacillus sp. B15-48]